MLKKNIKIILQRFPTLYLFIRNIYMLCTTTYIIDMLRYYIKFYYFDKNKMKNLEVTNIRLFNTKNWRFGYGLDHAYRRYYTAILKKQKVFIKIATNDETTNNEIIILRTLQNKHNIFLPKLFYGNNEKDTHTSILILEKKIKLRPFEIPSSAKEFDRLCIEFFLILKFFHQNGIVHADIHKNNLMIDENNHLVVLDFGISSMLNIKNSINYIARPGTFFREKRIDTNKIRIYDDAYSFLMMLIKLNIPPKWLERPPCQQIKEQIDLFNLSIKLNNFK